jgi:phosphoglucomutase
VPATAPLKNALKSVTAERFDMTELAGDRVTAKRTTAPGNNQPFGGIKVETEMGWFAARPSGTEDVCKIYAESFRDGAHLKQIQSDAQAAMARLA